MKMVNVGILEDMQPKNKITLFVGDGVDIYNLGKKGWHSIPT